MDLENTPGLTIAKRAAVAAYEEVYSVYAASATDALFDHESAKEEKTEGLGYSIGQVEQAYYRLSELAPLGTAHTS
jgi:hypothetical protein